MDSVLIIAAEASSSLYAQRLLEHWQAQGRHIKAFGIGSRTMEKTGFECLGRSEDLAVVGLQEVIKHLPQIREVYNKLIAEAKARRPKFALLMDYPDFNLRLAKKLKKMGVVVIYYISPQIWAWRTGRIKIIKRVVDHMLVLFPFEEPFYRDHGVKVSFVGHPLLDELGAPCSEGEQKVHRERFGIEGGDVVLGLMPGSRRSEIAHHLSTQLETARLLKSRIPNLRVVLMLAPTLERPDVKAQLEAVSFPLQIIKEEPLQMISLADAILVASGTATLMVGLMEKPMVIMYRMNRLTAWLAKLLVTKTKFFGMVNLVSDRLVVPELFQEQANPERMAKELQTLLFEPATRARTIDDLKQIKLKLGERGATVKVAKILEEYLT